MRYYLALAIAAISAPVFGALSIPHTVLTPEALAEMGLTLEVRDINDIAPFLEAPLSFALTVEGSSTCDIDDAYVFVKDGPDDVIYGSSIALRGGHYHFQLQSIYTQFSTLNLTCREHANHLYLIELRDHIQSP